jgi:hypothetical protein
MFLAHTSCLKVRIKQLDLIGAFLQDPMRTRMLILISKIFGILFLEYAQCCGIPVRWISKPVLLFTVIFRAKQSQKTSGYQQLRFDL